MLSAFSQPPEPVSLSFTMSSNKGKGVISNTNSFSPPQPEFSPSTIRPHKIQKLQGTHPQHIVIPQDCLHFAGAESSNQHHTQSQESNSPAQEQDQDFQIEITTLKNQLRTISFTIRRIMFKKASNNAKIASLEKSYQINLFPLKFSTMLWQGYGVSLRGSKSMN